MPTPVPPLQVGELKLTWRNMSAYPNPPRFMIRFDALNEDRRTLHLDTRNHQTEALRAFVGCLSDFIEAAARNPDDSLGSVIQSNAVASRLRQQRADPQASPSRTAPAH